MNHARAGISEIHDAISDKFHEKLAEVKPKLRGWLHLGTVPVVLACGIVLVSLAPNAMTRVGAAVFTISALLLFTVSAVYHRGNWSPHTWAVLRRWDHSNIFVLIAGSYTPFSLILLDGTAQITLLSVVWGGAILGVLFKIFWLHAPRWLYVPIYMALGWAAIFFTPQMFSGATRLGVGIGIAVMVLIIVGGALYTTGGVIYGLKKPNPWPQWFGFHEVFHTFTILAFVTHYVGASLAIYALR